MNKKQSNKLLTKRNHNLDLLKAIAAYFVVVVHCCFPAPTNEIIDTIARFSVPIFFMISGYYVYSPSYNYEYSIKKIKFRIIHIAKLTLIACVLYFFLSPLWIDYMPIKEWILSLIKFSSILKLILFNYTDLSPHLWFLFALLYAYILYLIVYKFNLIKTAYKLIPILLLILLVFGKMNWNVYEINIPNYLIRNFLFYAFPFFMIGHFIRNNDIINKITLKPNHFPVIVIFFTLIAMIERYFFGQHHIYFGNLIVSLYIFLFALKFPQITSSNNKLAIIGDKYSLFIYIVHYGIFKLILKALLYYNLDENLIIRYLLPFVISIITTILAIIFYNLKDKPILKRKSL